MKQIILSVFFFSIAAANAVTGTATFRNSYVRYVSGHDIFRLLAQKFPDADWSSLRGCDQLGDSNSASLGVANPANGQLTYLGPSVPYAKWYYKCLGRGIAADLAQAATKPHGTDRFFGPEAGALLTGNFELAAPWNHYPLKVRRAIARNLILTYIGPNILQDETAFGDKLASSLEGQTLSTGEALKNLLMLVASRGEFLSY